MTIANYLDKVNQHYKSGHATEHTYRGDFAELISSIAEDILVTNEPRKQQCGAPDYILTKNNIPVGFIEAKDIGDKDLDGDKKTGNKEQFDRYKVSLDNLIFTDYINFHLYRAGELITKISIAEITDKGIKPLTENFAGFANLVKDFCTHIGQTIKSSQKLAEMMAGKARLLSDIIGKALSSDETNQADSTLKDQMLTFKKILIHDITPQGFADVYAQTIAYGMFAARLHDSDLDSFSRQEAAELIPKSNPFLRKLFGYIAGPDIDDRIKWVVENLSKIFLACNVAELLKNYGKSTKTEDPIIHFYETFLSEYDPKLRKSRGVWYTPQPVVAFIVRAVDDILKSEFDLPDGLADTSKTIIKVDSQATDGRSASGYKKIEQEVHKVQILDPATGTGTFLAEVVKHIYKKFQGQQGIWSNYVETHLLPRLNGFELLMASYAMAHLKLDLLLNETGFKPASDQRFRVYLTNSLEEHHPDTGTLFASWLSTEANEANHIKRDTPVMCVIGNPPYSGESANKGEWIMRLMEDYKKEPGGKEKLKERNPKWINDDYVKFLRYGQHFVEKNGSGILAFINPHGFLDNPTFRGMRWHLLKTYDKIYTIDLHGNSKKKETAPDGSADINVFDIMQGVSINIFVKTGKKFPSRGGVPNGRGGQLGKVFHYDLYGKREFKYDFLNNNSLKSINFAELQNVAPMYFMVQKDFEAQKTYDEGFSVSEIFSLNSVGIVTARDKFTIHQSKEELKSTIDEFLSLEDEEARKKFNLGKDVRDWKVSYAKSDLERYYPDKGSFTTLSYRPFDDKWTFFTGKSKGFHCYPRTEVMQHFLKGDNIGLTLCKQFKTGDNYVHAFITSKVIESSYVSNRTSEITSTFPLYLYPETTPSAEGGHPSAGGEYSGEFSNGGELGRVPNLNTEIVNQIAEKLGLTFTTEKFPSCGGVDTEGGRGGRNTQNYTTLPHNPKLKDRAKELRKAGNLSEVLLWNQVKNKQFKGYDFDRQKIIGNYIVDFFCTNCNVVIEIDGSSHDDKVEYDTERDAFLESLGLTIVHIPVSDVMKNMEGVMQMLFEHAALKEPPRPLKADTPPKEGNFAPIDILDYIYAVLHSPKYREKYKEFLKIDFPIVPYPKNKNTFWKLVKLGGEIRQIHLLESPRVEQYITQYPIDGDNLVNKPPKYKDGKVYINDTQHFANVPQIAWDFYIGGYQPAQKWLKDRKDRKLEFNDVLYYQKIIVALSETDRLMKEIDKIKIN